LNTVIAAIESGLAKPPAGGGSGSPAGDPPPASRTSDWRPKRDYAAEFGIPKEAVEAIIGDTEEYMLPRLEKRLADAQAIAAEREGHKKNFYDKNPDLQGYELEVGAISNQVSAEAVRNKWSLDKQFEEVAKRTRAHIAKRGGQGGGGSGQPPAILDGNGNRVDGGGGDQGGGGGDLEVLDPNKSIDEEVSSRRGPIKRY